MEFWEHFLIVGMHLTPKYKYVLITSTYNVLLYTFKNIQYTYLHT